MSNDMAYHHDDANKILVDIATWIKKYGPEVEGRCRLCDLPIKVRAERSADRKAHFTHHPGALCPTVEDNHVPYNALKGLPRDPSVAIAAKKYVRDNALAIYEKCRNKLLAQLSWKEFHLLIEKANLINVWALKDMPHFFLPYVLMTCSEKFTAQNQKRPYDCFFVLEPFPTGATDLWNFSMSYKKYLWRIDLPKRNAEKIEITNDLDTPWYIAKMNKLLL